ncbi:MAG: tetratricopeptide repeat protein [Verrucomicrobiaceae bacterium]|nr:tetratricopeptide repeat protein [Verrucomicrobiaceae bacterium]
MPARQQHITAIEEDHAAGLLKEGKLEEALRVATTGLAAARQAAEEDASRLPVLIKALESLGDVHREMNETDRAEKRYREAVDLLTKVELSPAKRGEVRARLATLLDFSQREAAAVPYYEQAIDDYEAMDPPDEDVTAQLRNNLAMIYKGLGKYALSEQHYLRGLEILEQRHGHESEFTATLFNNLGSLYYAAGFPEQGREMLEEALEIRTRLLGPDHPDVAQTHSNLASTCHDLGNNDSALEHYELGLSILESHIEDEAASYEAVGLDYIALLESLGDEKRASAFRKRMQRMLAK